MLRYIPQNLSMNEAAPVCQSWSYPVNHPMESVMGQDYFLSAHDRLRPGDTIRIVQMRDANVHSRNNVVIAFCDALVVQSGVAGVFLYVGEVTVIKDKPVEEVKEERKVAWNPGRKVYELKEGEKVLFSSKDKVEVESWQPSSVL